MEQVLQCNDLIEIILHKLPFYIVSSLLPVNKQFYIIGKDIYNMKLKDIYNYSYNMLNYINTCVIIRHELSFIQIKNVYQQFNQYLKDLSLNNHWPILVYEPDFCEKFFLLSSQFKYYFISHETMFHPLYLENKEWFQLFKPIKKYLFIQNPREYTLNKLRVLATLKGIKRNYKLNKSELISRLKFKNSKMYKLNIL